MNFRRFIIVFSILAYTNFFGLLPSEKLTFFIPLQDYALILIGFYLFTNLKYIKLDYLVFLKPISILILLAIIVIVSMPLRGEIGIIESFKFGRIFLTFLFSFLIFLDIYQSKSYAFVLKIVYILSAYYSFIVIMNIFFPVFISKVLSGMSTLSSENPWEMSGNRYVVKGNSGILFIHLGFILKTFEYAKNKGKGNLIFVVFLFLGVLFQGWRAPMISLLFVIVIYVLRSKSFSRLRYFIPVLGLSIISIISIEYIVQQKITSLNFISVYNELTGEYSGTLEGRTERSYEYQIPMFLKKKWFGYGFIHKDSKLAKQIGHAGDGPKSLYYFDFGYITLLNMFGIFGVIIFMYLIIKIAIKSWVLSNHFDQVPFYGSLTIFTFTLILSNYSFGALISDVGILPLSYIVGITQGHLLLRKEDSIILNSNTQKD